MSWRVVQLPSEVPVVFDPQPVVIGSDLHVLVGSSSDDGVRHVLIAHGGGGAEISRLPLASVTGVARAGRDLVVAGSRMDDRAAAVQRVPEMPITLPETGPISAWPVVVDGQPAKVVWATGVDRSTVWLGEVRPAEVTAEALFDGEPVLGLQAADSEGEVQLLVETVSDTQVVRVDSHGHSTSPALRDAVLVSGYLMRAAEAGIVVRSVADGNERTVRVSDWPGGARARVSSLTYDGGLLTWTTERVDDPDERDPRGWVARFDPALGTAGQPVSLPFPGESSVGRLVGDRVVVVQSVGGRLAVWYDDADAL